MTVVIDPGHLSWKVTIPIATVLLAVAIGVWAFPIYGYYFEQRFWKYVLNVLLDLSALILIGMLIAWSVHKDEKESR